VTRGDKGIILPSRNAFDFVEKPRSQAEDFETRGSSSSAKNQNGQEKIKRVMNGIKRLSKTSLVNRRMRTVKADF